MSLRAAPMDRVRVQLMARGLETRSEMGKVRDWARAKVEARAKAKERAEEVDWEQAKGGQWGWGLVLMRGLGMDAS